MHYMHNTQHAKSSHNTDIREQRLRFNVGRIIYSRSLRNFTTRRVKKNRDMSSSANSDANEDGTCPTVDTPTGIKVSLKNTFINVDEGHQDLSMPDLLRAQTTPAVFNALQALYSNVSACKEQSWQSVMDPVVELTDECAPPLDEMLRQISETLSAMNCDLSQSTDRSVSPLVDEMTTVMLRNIPNKYTSVQLLEVFRGYGFCPGEFDFFYLPIDFRNKCNVGYCFVNFLTTERASEFMKALDSVRLPATNSTKVCTLCWARVQGKHANVLHYQDSPIAPEYRPLLFRTDGERDPFPEPAPEVLAAIAQASTEAARAANAIRGPDSHKIFVGGIDKTICGADIVSYFSKFGQVRDGAVVIDRTSGKSRGFGFCLFERAIPHGLFDTQHTIKGVQVAIKLYETPQATRR